jgi:hypothetical protein
MEKHKDEKFDLSDFYIFEDKTFSDLANEIYTTSKKKEVQIDQLISQLKPLVTSVTAAQVIVPLVKEYLEVSVKNDEQLVKLAAVLQRHASTVIKGKNKNTNSSTEYLLTEDEKLQLIQIAEQELKELN